LTGDISFGKGLRIGLRIENRTVADIPGEKQAITREREKKKRE